MMSSDPYRSQPLSRNYTPRVNASLPMTHVDSDPTRVDLGMLGEQTQPTVWDAVNYPREDQFEFDSFWLRYERQSTARAIIDKPVNDTWQEPPEVLEIEPESEESDDSADDDDDDEEDETDEELPTDASSGFVDDMEAFFEGEHTRRKPTHRLNVADKLARLGHYSLIVLGFADGRDLSTPVQGVEDEQSPEFGGLDDLLYIATFGEDRVLDMDVETDMTSSRYRLPTSFEVVTQEPEDNESQANEAESETQHIHWSRCIHVPEGTLEDDLQGTPALKPVFHELLNIDKIKAASGEGYWRGGYQGMVVSPPKDDRGRLMDFDDDADGVKQEITEFLNNFERTISTPAEIQTLENSVGDPNPHLEANYQGIAAALDLPKAVLFGKERADRASNEDLRQWHQKIGERRNNHAGPVILEPLIQRLIDVGIVAEPEHGGFTVEWQPLDELTEEQEADLMLTKAKAFSQASPGGDASHLFEVPELRHLLGFEPEMGGELPEGFEMEEDDEEIEVDEEMLARFEEQMATAPEDITPEMAAQQQSPGQSPPEQESDD